VIRPKKLPYAGTEKDPEATISDINRMLRDVGITSYQWTTLWESGRVELLLAVEEEGGKVTPLRLIAPAFLAKRKTWNAKVGRYETVQAPNWSQSMRLFYWYLKTKLEAIAYGLREVREEFLHDVVVKDAQGRETTVGEMVLPAIAAGKLDLPSLGGGADEGSP